MKTLIFCDFATMKCTRSEFAQRLLTYGYCENINNFLWVFSPNDDYINFYDSESESVYSMVNDFLNKDSVLLVVQPSDFVSHNKEMIDLD